RFARGRLAGPVRLANPGPMPGHSPARTGRTVAPRPEPRRLRRHRRLLVAGPRRRPFDHVVHATLTHAHGAERPCPPAPPGRRPRAGRSERFSLRPWYTIEGEENPIAKTGHARRMGRHATVEVKQSPICRTVNFLTF